ncbi:MAG: sigma-70 family RNA polymerase sigma factor [bacterium]|nr:sigma-70 family RNA polymerase sigma factor [bacterium]
MRSVRDGRIQNFEILVNRYKNRIVNFIHKMIYDYDEAQSLTQDVFLKVFENMKKYKEQDNFQAFIFTIAKNLTLNYIKKHKRISWLSSQQYPENMENRYFRSEETQHADLERTQQEEMITTALKTLKENQRIALILKVYLEFSYKKIAEITGWSEPKIETLISRAKSNLKAAVRSRENIRPESSQRSGSGEKSKKKLQEKHKTNVLNMRST